jgi:hypothetical protein
MAGQQRYNNFLGDIARACDARAAATERSRQAAALLEVARAAKAETSATAWENLHCGTLDHAYVRFLGAAILLCCRKPANKARFALRNLAAQLERGRGRFSCNGRHIAFALQLAGSVRALADCLPGDTMGNPEWGKLDSNGSRAVYAAYGELAALAQRMGYRKWLAELARPGRGGKPSRGRELLVQAAKEYCAEGPDARPIAELVRVRCASERRTIRRAEARFLKFWTTRGHT